MLYLSTKEHASSQGVADSGVYQSIISEIQDGSAVGHVYRSLSYPVSHPM